MGLDLLAPGGALHVAYPGDTGEGLFGGASAATPIVAGVAALVLSANKYLTAKEVGYALTATCEKEISTDGDLDPPPGYDENGWCPRRGHGRIRALEAVEKSNDMRACWRVFRAYLLRVTDWVLSWSRFFSSS